MKVHIFAINKLKNDLSKYSVKHWIATAYHTQVNGQVEVSNCVIKKILEKIVNSSWKKNWLVQLVDAL